MEIESNLHVSVSPELLTRVQEAAQDDHITVNELVQSALEQRLQARQRAKLYTYGEGQACSAGIRGEDVPHIVEEWRAEHPEHER
jgi:predicted transcriptional regulator